MMDALTCGPGCGTLGKVRKDRWREESLCEKEKETMGVEQVAQEELETGWYSFVTWCALSRRMLKSV